MQMRSFLLGIMLIVLLRNGTSVAQTPSASKPVREPSPALAPVKDIAGLPRVLLIGDSISIGYTLRVRELLQGKAGVHRPPVNCSSTSYALQNLDKWLGDKPWDLIHFNFGLHDAKLPPEGVRHSPPETYQRNLEALVERMRKKSARLIFATTTPVPNNGILSPVRRFGSIDQYNSLARVTMQNQQIAINDLNAIVSPQADKILIHRTDEQGVIHWDVHFTAEGYDVLAEQVAATIEAGLAKPANNPIIPAKN